MKEALPAGETRAESRLAICAQCPIFVDGVCVKKLGGCGCNMKIKAALPLMRCPKGKW